MVRLGASFAQARRHRHVPTVVSRGFEASTSTTSARAQPAGPIIPRTFNGAVRLAMRERPQPAMALSATRSTTDQSRVAYLRFLRRERKQSSRGEADADFQRAKSELIR